ncbi:transcription initiation factor tfiid subunit 4 [Plakobranchus ocellatus]|uniref:Transcription initiation factor tfiid subunit 4 n=1 Tax=Plakobranchus ocellatus TaxID=259542 RepID=A0AAV4BMX7_9GAST|nr:transcription initiation factor tfiid subunit 4 [Plakobranchus ocellatus]
MALQGSKQMKVTGCQDCGQDEEEFPNRSAAAIAVRSRVLQYRDAKGVILLDILPQGQCIKLPDTAALLTALIKEAIHRKRPGLLRRGVVLQQDNATPHSTNLTQQWLQRYGWEILPHPAQSPDLAPSDFHLFGPLKRHLGGMAFETEDDLISELRNWFDNLDVDFFRKSLPLLRQLMLKGQMTIEGIRAPPVEVVPPLSQPSGVTQRQQTTGGTPGTQQVATVRGTFQQRPILPQQQQQVTPVQQQMTVRPSPGPQSSRVAPIRHTAPIIRQPGQQQQHLVRPIANSAVVRASSPQVTITPGGGKVVVHASPQPQQAQVRPKGMPRPSPTAVRATKPQMGSPAASSVKSDLSSLGPAPREKRKFESIKDGDDDFNDVATMGGVNLSEESKNILATTNADFIGAQSRSCKDEIFLAASPLLRKITAIAKKYGVEEISPAVVNLISHATQERLRDLVSKLSTTAEHRIEIYKMDTRFDAVSETKQKLKFLEELDKLEKKRHEEQEREKLLRAIKSRSKNEDPEQAELKQKAKELQQAEAEELRQKEANLTALAAIGPRKKRKLDFSDAGTPGSSVGGSLLNSSVNSPRANVLRPRIKRVNMKDVQIVLESERQTRKSDLLYKTFLK